MAVYLVYASMVFSLRAIRDVARAQFRCDAALPGGVFAVPLGPASLGTPADPDCSDVPVRILLRFRHSPILLFALLLLKKQKLEQKMFTQHPGKFQL